MPIKEIKEQMGKVLIGALHIESHLEFFIANYFIRPQNQKTFFFKDAIFTKMGFQSKIVLFKEICEREGFDREKVLQVTDSIGVVQRIRNKVAHWELVEGLDKTIQLRKRKSRTCEKDNLRLDKGIMQTFEEERLKSINGITEFYLKYFKEGTVDEKSHKLVS